MKPGPDEKEKNKLLFTYIGFATQLIVSIGIAVWGGKKLDEMTGISTPLLVWILPLVVIGYFLYKAIKDTGARK